MEVAPPSARPGLGVAANGPSGFAGGPRVSSPG